jgi:hypothetical protein
MTTLPLTPRTSQRLFALAGAIAIGLGVPAMLTFAMTGTPGESSVVARSQLEPIVITAPRLSRDMASAEAKGRAPL